MTMPCRSGLLCQRRRQKEDQPAANYSRIGARNREPAETLRSDGAWRRCQWWRDAVPGRGSLASRRMPLPSSVNDHSRCEPGVFEYRLAGEKEIAMVAGMAGSRYRRPSIALGNFSPVSDKARPGRRPP